VSIFSKKTFSSTPNLDNFVLSKSKTAITFPSGLSKTGATNSLLVSLSQAI